MSETLATLEYGITQCGMEDISHSRLPVSHIDRSTAQDKHRESVEVGDILCNVSLEDECSKHSHWRVIEVTRRRDFATTMAYVFSGRGACRAENIDSGLVACLRLEDFAKRGDND